MVDGIIIIIRLRIRKDRNINPVNTIIEDSGKTDKGIWQMPNQKDWV